MTDGTSSALQVKVSLSPTSATHTSNASKLCIYTTTSNRYFNYTTVYTQTTQKNMYFVGNVSNGSGTYDGPAASSYSITRIA